MSYHHLNPQLFIVLTDRSGRIFICLWGGRGTETYQGELRKHFVYQGLGIQNKKLNTESKW